MKSIRYSLLALALAAAGAAAQVPAPQPPTDRGGSPYDSNPACQDRDVSSANPACVIQDGPPLYRSLDTRSQVVAPPMPTPVQGNASPPVIVVVPQGARP